MSWSKLSDDFADDCWTLSDKAFRLHVEGLCWSNRKLLDCRIPVDDLRKFAKHPEILPELLDAGWWERDGDVLVIRHHAQYQRLRQAVVNQQAANQANGKKGGRPRREIARTDSVSERVTETESLSESLSESETERDRPGQDRALMGELSQRGASEPEPCFGCGGSIEELRRAYSTTCLSCYNKSREAS